MAEKSAIAALKDYFNVGDGKRLAVDFRKEIVQLTKKERQELAAGVCAITGDTLAE